MTTIVEQISWRKTIQITMLSVLLFIAMQLMVSYLFMDETLSFNELIIQGAILGLLFGLVFTYMISKFGKRVTSQISPELSENEKVEVEGPANLFKGIEGVGGKLFITNKKVVFKSHKFNIQKGQTNIDFKEIIDVSTRKTAKILNNGIRIRTNTGDKFDFVVHQRDAWIKQLGAKLIDVL